MKEWDKVKDLTQTRKIQNKLFYDDVYDTNREQNYFVFLGNHPTLFQEFIDPGFLTIAEMNYINEHFHDYNVDPRTFENEFKRAMREALPRYNNLKAIELVDEVFKLTDNDYVRHIVSERANTLSQSGTGSSSSNSSNTDDSKSAAKTLPMKSDGYGDIEDVVDWGNGASGINEVFNTGSSNITASDSRTLTSNGTDNGDNTETFEQHGVGVEHVDKIWKYLVKPKAIEYLTSQLAVAFVLVY